MSRGVLVKYVTHTHGCDFRGCGLLSLQGMDQSELDSNPGFPQSPVSVIDPVD